MTPEELADLHAACFPDAPMSAAQIATKLSMPANRLYTSRDAFLIAAVVPPEADISDIGVHPRARGQGHARRLIEALQADVDVIFLEVAESNSAARRLYERTGFTVIQRRSDYYETADGFEDALLMRWTSAAADTAKPQESVDPPGASRP